MGHHQRTGRKTFSFAALRGEKHQTNLRAYQPLLGSLVHSHSFTRGHWLPKEAPLLTENRRGTKTGPVQRSESWVRLLWMFRWRDVLDSPLPSNFGRGVKMQCRSLLELTGRARWTDGSGPETLPGRAFFAVGLQKCNGRG